VDSFSTPGAESPAARDQRMFKEWKNAVGYKKEQALEALMQSLMGPIMTAVNMYTSGSPVARPILETQGKIYAVEALQEYDPSRSTNLSTYVLTAVKNKLYRYNGMHQNVARIPEAKIQQIAPYRAAVSDLTQKMGRDPSSAEIADHLGVPLKHVTKLEKMMRRDLLQSGPGGFDELSQFEHDENYERAMLAYYSLTPDEQQVFDYSLGAHGKQKLSNNEIASKLKMSAGRVSQLRTSIADKLNMHMSRV